MRGRKGWCVRGRAWTLCLLACLRVLPRAQQLCTSRTHPHSVRLCCAAPSARQRAARPPPPLPRRRRQQPARPTQPRPRPPAHAPVLMLMARPNLGSLGQWHPARLVEQMEQGTRAWQQHPPSGPPANSWNTGIIFPSAPPSLASTMPMRSTTVRVPFFSAPCAGGGGVGAECVGGARGTRLMARG